MLKRVSPRKVRRAGSRFAIVASRYNARYVDAMVRAAKRTLQSAGSVVEVVRVPGAFEIPVVAARLAAGGSFDGILCL
jgi:6,7-dimethyl-8-ribityllumazine synthase